MQITTEILERLTLSIAHADGEFPLGKAQDQEQDLQIFFRANRCIFRHNKNLWITHIDDLNPPLSRAIETGLLLWLEAYVNRNEINLFPCLLETTELRIFGVPEA